MCMEHGMGLLHVSTDYVFDGKQKFYDEDDPTGPLNIYGHSKLAGEILVRQECPEALIVRTQSLFGKHGVNFVEAILKQVAAGKKELGVVDDQFSCPTYVGHLAQAMVKLMTIGDGGTVHVSNEGEMSWYAFAKMILKEAGVKDVVVNPTKSFDGREVKAVRPACSVLSKARYEVITGEAMPLCGDGLREYLRVRG